MPLLDQLFPQFASRLIRNGATFGGNLGTGSPIGDAPPALLALEPSVVLAGRDGEREVPLATYFTGYRKTVRRPGELIRAVRIPLPLAPLTAFHKIAKRRFDDISSVAVAFALDVRDGVVARAAIGLGGVAATPLRATATEDGAGGPAVDRGDAREAAAAVLRAEGTPMDDHRASAAYRAAMLGAEPAASSTTENPATAAGGRRHERAEHAPATPSSGVDGPARERRPARHRASRSTPTTWSTGTTDVLHAYPVQAPHAHARVTALRTAPALEVPGVVRVLTAADVPGVNDAGVKHDEPLFPDEVMFHGHAVCWVLGETLEAARLGALAVEVEYEPLPSLVTIADAIAAESFQGARPTRAPRRPGGGVGRLRPRLRGRVRVRRPGALLPGDQRRAGHGRRERAGVRPVAAPSTRARPRRSSRTCSGLTATRSPCSACGWAAASAARRCSRTGFAAIAALGARLTGRPVRLRLNRTQDMTMTGKRHGFHAEWKVGFDADGRIQALDAPR